MKGENTKSVINPVYVILGVYSLLIASAFELFPCILKFELHPLGDKHLVIFGLITSFLIALLFIAIFLLDRKVSRQVKVKKNKYQKELHQYLQLKKPALFC